MGIIIKKLSKDITSDSKYKELTDFVKAMFSDVKMEPLNTKVTFDLEFSGEVTYPVNKVTNVTNDIVLNVNMFFRNSRLFYTKSKKNGYNVRKTFDLNKLVKVKANISTENDDFALKAKRALALAKQIPTGVWPELRDKLVDDPITHFPHADFRPIYHAVRFKSSDRDKLRAELKDAFNKRKPYIYEQYTNTDGSGNGRNLRLELGSDMKYGYYKGMLYSTSPKSGKTDVLFILNDKISFFVETDYTEKIIKD